MDTIQLNIFYNTIGLDPACYATPFDVQKYAGLKKQGEYGTDNYTWKLAK